MPRYGQTPIHAATNIVVEYTNKTYNSVHEALRRTSYELKGMIRENFDMAHTAFQSSEAGITSRAWLWENPAEVIRNRHPKIQEAERSVPTKGKGQGKLLLSVQYFNSEWLENELQIDRPDINLTVYNHPITIRGRVRPAGPDSQRLQGRYYYWRFLEFGTIAPQDYRMGEIKYKGESYFFMAKNKEDSKPKSKPKKYLVWWPQVPTFVGKNCVGNVIQGRTVENTYKKHLNAVMGRG